MQNTIAIYPSFLTQLLVNNRKRSFPVKKIFIGGLVAVLLLLFGLFIFQINFMTGESYLIESRQQKIKALASDNSSLEIEYSKKNYLTGQEDAVKLLNLEKTDRVYYISTVSEVAQR